MFIATLGTLELFDGTPDAPGPRVLGAGKPLAMLTYLALVRGRRATRGQLNSPHWQRRSDFRPSGPCGSAWGKTPSRLRRTALDSPAS